MLDGHKAINWWHRNVALAQWGYGLQGWKRGRIYPDFLFAVSGEGAARRIVALETKGDLCKTRIPTTSGRCWTI